MPTPEPGEGEVRIRARAVAVNPTDAMFRAGGRAAQLNAVATFARFEGGAAPRPAPPIALARPLALIG